jgi:transcriptional regulator with XRE-family HTH domain
MPLPHDQPHPARTFGETLRQLRRAANLTQRDLAAGVGIDFTYLSKLENDRDVPPGEETIRRLASALGCDTERLLAIAGKMPPELKQRAAADPRFAMLLRKLPDLSRDKLDEVYREAGVPPEPE